MGSRRSTTVVVIGAGPAGLAVSWRLSELSGLYTIGQPVLRSRRSGLIAGIARDASAIAAELSRYVRRRFAAASTAHDCT